MDSPCKGGVQRWYTEQTPGNTHAHAHTHTELGQQPQWNCHFHLISPSTASKAKIKGTAVQSHPTHSQTQSHLPGTLGTTDLLGVKSHIL